jgi:hypothetical protein
MQSYEAVMLVDDGLTASAGLAEAGFRHYVDNLAEPLALEPVLDNHFFSPALKNNSPG